MLSLSENGFSLLYQLLISLDKEETKLEEDEELKLTLFDASFINDCKENFQLKIREANIISFRATASKLAKSARYEDLADLILFRFNVLQPIEIMYTFNPFFLELFKSLKELPTPLSIEQDKVISVIEKKVHPFPLGESQEKEIRLLFQKSLEETLTQRIAMKSDLTSIQGFLAWKDKHIIIIDSIKALITYNNFHGVTQNLLEIKTQTNFRQAFYHKLGVSKKCPPELPTPSSENDTPEATPISEELFKLDEEISGRGFHH